MGLFDGVVRDLTVTAKAAPSWYGWGSIQASPDCLTSSDVRRSKSGGMSVVTEAVREASKLTKEEWREYTKTVWHIANVSHPGHPAVFPAEIPHRLIKLFSFFGETVLDPFAGAGTTAAKAVSLGRRSISIELNPEYASLIRQAAGDEMSLVYETDCRRLPFVDDASIDLIITSPPYWNKADYGSDVANLGNQDSYVHFLGEMRPVFAEMYRVLRPGRKVCVVTANVNQHTDHGLLTFPLAADFTLLLRDLGFVMINELIWSKDRTGGRWGSAGVQRPIFGSYPYPPNFLFKNVHEYILVFAKPPDRASTGPKVVSYRSLMSSKAATKELGLTDTVIRQKSEVEDLADPLHELKRLP